jgi:PTH1 family peptidyl-tRNA hydrolase
MKLVTGLGNPGQRYRDTRHNIGFAVVEALATEARETFRVSRFEAVTAKVTIEGEKVLLMKPVTFMNLSGRAVTRALGFFKINLEDMLVVLDDIDLPTGRLRFRRNGGAGGHNGLRSIFGELGTQDVHRLRVGIGRSDDATRHVLSRFSPEEAAVMENTMDRACRAVRLWVRDGIETSMNRFNAAADEGKGKNRRLHEDEEDNRGH